jgi:pimeloyl-ACP methyl ester carboxylesterase
MLPPAGRQLLRWAGVIAPYRRRLASSLVALVACLQVASACSPDESGLEGQVVGPTTSVPGPPPAIAPTTTTPSGPLSWAPCRNEAGPARFDCATIQVPLDYNHPGLAAIGLALDRRPASGSKVGSLLINNGGPGVSGVDSLAYDVSLMSKAVLDHFDVIGFDPRGVARSAPVTCGDGPALDRFLDLDPAPTTDAGYQALVAGTKSFVLGCQARSGSILPFVSTENTARDMDQIRQAVGDTKLSYLGFSYGTLLGATYAELFPRTVRAMVLDGVVDPSVDAVSANIAQSAAFDQQLNAFFAECATNVICNWKPGGDLHAAFDALMARIRSQRLPGFGGRSLGAGEAFYGVSEPLYSRATWPDLALGLKFASRGNGALLLALADEYTHRRPDGSYGNVLEAFPAVMCLDQQWPSADALRQSAAAAAKAAPEFGVADLYGGLTCSFWPVPATGTTHAIKAAGSPPIVVVGSTGDPATPYAGAQALAGQLEHGVLLTRVGDGHTAYRASACIRRAVDAYLVDATVPANGTICQSP